MNSKFDPDVRHALELCGRPQIVDLLRIDALRREPRDFSDRQECGKQLIESAPYGGSHPVVGIVERLCYGPVLDLNTPSGQPRQVLHNLWTERTADNWQAGRTAAAILAVCGLLQSDLRLHQ